MEHTVRAGSAATGTIAVLTVPSPDWDSFVDQFPDRSIYLRSGWTLLARDVFGHQVFFIEARNASGALEGVLPLVRQKGLLGDFATSIPFFNYGGVLALTRELAVALMERARALASNFGCSYLELRETQVRDATWSIRNDKATMVLELAPTLDALSKRLGSKLRSQVKRAEREAVVVKEGRAELLRDFYSVFAHNMRDLGTPVYPLKFFRAIVDRFAENVLIVVVYHDDKPAAAGFLIIDRLRAEIPWAACLSDAKPLGMNMKLYWEVLSASVRRGCTSFDFGRSTVDSGTYKFKKQWGAQPVPLHWHRWERRPSSIDRHEAMSQGRLMRVATTMWRRLPVPVANVLGPLLAPSLPW